MSKPTGNSNVDNFLAELEKRISADPALRLLALNQPEEFERQMGLELMKMRIMPEFTISPDGKSITCHTCGKTSYNLGDVENRYCGHCHKFHEGP